MEKNEEILQKLRDFRMEKMIELKNKNLGYEVDIEDVIYCGQIDFEENGETIKKDVFLVVKNIDGNISMVYCTDNDEIAIQMDIDKMFDEDGIIPTEKYKDRNKDFEKLKENEDKRVSLNKLEEERMNNISKSLGIEDKDIKASSEIDTKNINEEELLKKYANVKSEFDPNRKITASENFGNLIPGANRFSKIAVVYSDKTADKFKLVGITGEGKVEEINGLVRTEGTNPTENVVSSNRDGSELKSKTVQAMYKIKGRPNEGFSMNIGSAGGVEVNYIRRSTDNEYISIPVEATHTRPVTAELKRNMDKSKNVRVEEEIDRAQAEVDEHNGKADFKNIDDNPNNDINHENILKTEDGKEKTYEEVIEEIEKEMKVSRKEAERLFEENRDEGETYEKVKSDIEEEIEEQLRINR